MTDNDAARNVPPFRVRRMLAALLGGLSSEAIGEEENLPAPAVEQALTDALSRRWAPSIADFAKIQIARLEHLTLLLLDRLQRGEFKAIDRALKIFDRLDRYHGFSRANPVVERYGEEDREKLLDKINAAAARLQADKSGE